MNTVFIVYSAKTKYGNIVESENCELKYDKNISHIEDIEEIEHMITKETGYNCIKVLNWRRFE